MKLKQRMNQLFKRKCHIYIWQIFRTQDELFEVLNLDQDWLNEGYRKLIQNNINFIYEELFYQYEYRPVIIPFNFIRDFMGLIRRMEYKVKAMVFGDSMINWDDPEVSDFVLNHEYNSRTINNNTPFMNSSDSTDNNRDYEENVNNQNYEISKFSANQRFKRVKGEDVGEQFVRDLRELFYRRTPQCEYCLEFNYA